MIPSIHTQEVAARARMDDRLHEARQYRLAHIVRQHRASRQDKAISASRSGWLLRLATLLSGHRPAAKGGLSFFTSVLAREEGESCNDFT